LTHSSTVANAGGKEGKDAQTRLAYKTGATQVLFLQHVIDRLRPAGDDGIGGRCGLVIDEGVLFRTNETAFVQTKRKLLDDCDLWCIVSIPPGVFSQAGAGVKTNLLFFNKGRPTERIWYHTTSATSRSARRRPSRWLAWVTSSSWWAIAAPAAQWGARTASAAGR